MRNLVFVALASIFPNLAWADCNGDLQGLWEKRPADTSTAFATIETFTVNSATGLVEQCAADRAWDGNYKAGGDIISFAYARRVRVLTRQANGDFLSDSWQAEFKGVTNEYRVRVLAP